MKIGFVISCLSNGGAERVASILANEWTNKGHKVVFYFTHGSEQVYNIHKGVIIKRIRNGSGTGYFKLIKTLKREIKLDKNDVVVSFMATPSFYAYLALKGSKTPLICSERNNPYVFPKSKIKRLARNIVFKKSAHVVFQTDEAQKFFSKKIQAKSSVIFNPCDYINPARLKDVSNVIISAGRLTEQKDFKTLIKGFSLFHKNNSSYKLVIYGSGEEENNLNCLIKELGLEGSAFIKPFSPTLREEIAKSKIFVSSSLYEGMPNVVIEALCIGTPVVASDCPIGGSKIVMQGNEYGFLFNVGDSGQLAHYLEKIANDYDYYYNGSIAFSKTIFTKLNPSEISNQWLSVIEKVVNK